MRRLPRIIALAALLGFQALALVGEPLYHVLQKGETVYAIARRYQVPAEAILSANGITDPGRLLVGAKLLIPATHTVKKGETLFGIARDLGVSLDELRAANKLGEKSLIKPGDVLIVPGGKAVAGAGGAAGGSSGAVVASKNNPSNATSSGGAGAGKTGSSGASGGAAAGGGSSSGTTGPSGGASGGASGGSSTTIAPPPQNKVALLPGGATPQSGASAVGKLADPAAGWPVPGDARYLDGKLRGVLIASQAGSPVKAVSSGTVVSAGAYRGYGLVAFIEGRGGHIFVYGGLDSLGVRAGDTVNPGALIGQVGIDRATGLPAAYFFVFKDGAALDPALAPRG